MNKESDTNESHTLQTLLKFIQGSSCKCSVCGKIIYPTITRVDIEPRQISIESNNYKALGGKGNKVLIDNVCPDCAKRAASSLYN